jgi:hypothetical protein
MNDTKPEKPEEHAVRLSVGDPRSCQATILKVADGYTVMVALEGGSRIRMLSESSVESSPTLRQWRKRSRHSTNSPGTRSR